MTRAEREASAALAEASANEHQAAEQLHAIEERLGDIDVEIETRYASKAYQKGAELNHLRDEERQLRERAQSDSDATVARTAEQTQRAVELEQAQEQCNVATSNLRLASDEVHQIALGLGAEQLRNEMLDAARHRCGPVVRFGLGFGTAPAGARGPFGDRTPRRRRAAAGF